METPTDVTPKHEDGNFLRIQDVLYMCLKKWYWFIASLAVVLLIAVYYILSTPPVYTRTASLLIKEDSKGNSLNGAAGVMGDIDLFQTSTNVNNEIQAISSPAVMLDVVKRLRLDISYFVKGKFYDAALYGMTLPFEVVFLDLQDNETASLVVTPEEGGRATLSQFTYNADEFDQTVQLAMNDTAATPAGRVILRPTAHYDAAFEEPVMVYRSTLNNTVERYSAALSVALSDKESTVINLSFQDVCIQRAEDVLNTLIAVYNENWVKDKNQIAVSTSLFIGERLNVIERELGAVDENISSYKSVNLLPDVSAVSNMYMQQSSEMNKQILALNTQLAMARYIRSYMVSTNNRNQLLPANSGLESNNIEKQISEYNTMQLQRNNLVANSSEQNPLVVDLDQSLNALREAIITSIDNLVVTLNTQLASLEQSEEQTTARLAANPVQAKHLLSEERQQKVKESLYLFLLQKREENELSQAFTAYNTRVITPPGGSMLPTSPVKRNILLVAFVIGLFIPALIIYLRESLYTKVRGRKDLGILSIPFIGEIPLIGKKKSWFVWKKEKADELPGIVVKPKQRDVINEAFRVVRANFEFMSNSGKTQKVIMATSVNVGSGKTFTVANLAACLAVKGVRVVAVDLDLRKASLSRYVMSPRVGVSNFLAGQEVAVDDITNRVDGYPTFDIIPVGTIPPNPTELLLSDRLQELLATLRENYDYVLLDCPPVEIVADSSIVSRLADQTLFIIRAGLLEREMLPEINRLSKDGKYPSMAIVLNGTDSTNSRFSYGYKYGYGGGVWQYR